MSRPDAQWQPIETAPKDGTAVLLWLGAPWSEVRQMWWYDPWDVWLAAGEDEPDAGDERFGCGSAIPTHWMPLPAPPSDAQREGE